jgi:hypothetical protein
MKLEGSLQRSEKSATGRYPRQRIHITLYGLRLEPHERSSHPLDFTPVKWIQVTLSGLYAESNEYRSHSLD